MKTTDSTAAGLATAVGVAAVLAPLANLWRASPRDSFPLSHYPMFSSRRGERIAVTYLRAVLGNGTDRRLDSRLAASGGMNQERKQISRAARRDRGDRLARRVARRLVRRGLADDVVAVEVITAEFLVDQYFRRRGADIEPVEIRVVGRHRMMDDVRADTDGRGDDGDDERGSAS